IGGWNLKNDKQRHHARDHAKDSRTGLEGFGIEHHWAAKHNLKRERIKPGEKKRLMESSRKLRQGGSDLFAVCLAVRPVGRPVRVVKSSHVLSAIQIRDRMIEQLAAGVEHGHFSSMSTISGDLTSG